MNAYYIDHDRDKLRDSTTIPSMPNAGEGKPPAVVLLRHGESVWNNANRFTGWVDVPLSMRGESQATQAGALLRTFGFRFDRVYTSYLQRTVRTAELVLEQLPQGYESSRIRREWRLNERMYGALTGLNKRQVADKYGQKQMEEWVRDPPPLSRASKYFPGNDPVYDHLPREELPVKESFEDCMRRVVPLWEERIKPDVDALGQRVLIISSRNAIRALLMHISDIPTKELLKIDIPNGIPLVYEMHNDCLKTIDSDSCNFGISGPFVASPASRAVD